MGKMRTAFGLGRADQRLIVEAAVALLVARLRSALPFRIVARQLGGIVAPHMTPTIPKLVPTPASRPVPNSDEDAIQAVRWAIRMTAPSMPFRAVCLQQAIAARAMLDRRGIASVLHLGVSSAAGSPKNAALEAHAWLDAGGLWVTGYPVDPALTEVGRFVRRPGERSASARG